MAYVDTAIHILEVMVLLTIGTSIHVVLLLQNISDQRKERVTLTQFCKERPYKLTLMVIGAVVAYLLIMDQVPDPTPIMVVACGYAGNDAIDKLSSITAHMRLRNGKDS